MTRLMLVTLVSVLATSVGAAQDAKVPVARLVEEWRLDGAVHQLGAINAAFVSATGMVALPEHQMGRVLVFGPDGQLRSTVGRRGSGPGEFQNLSPVGGWVGDTLWLFDNGTQRLTWMRPDGRVVRSVLLRHARVGPSAGRAPRSPAIYDPLAVRADGSILAVRATPRPGTSISDLQVVAITPRAEVLRVLADVPPNPAAGSRVAVPFISWLLPASSNDGTRVVLSAPTEGGAASGVVDLTVLDERGEPVARARHAFTAKPIPSRVRDSVLQAHLNRRGPTVVVGGVPPQQVTGNQEHARAVEEELRRLMPAMYPVVHSVRVATDHSLWLERERADSGSSYLACAATGECTLGVRLPARARLVHVDATHVWTRELDDDDVPSIVRYRMVR